MGWRGGGGVLEKQFRRSQWKNHLQIKGYVVPRRKQNRVWWRNLSGVQEICPQGILDLMSWAGFYTPIIISNLERRDVLASVQTPIPRLGYPSSRCCELNPSPELIGAASPGKAGTIPPSPQVITLSQQPALCKRAAPCSRWDNQWDCSRSRAPRGLRLRLGLKLSPRVHLASSSVPSWTPQSLAGFTCKHSHWITAKQSPSQALLLGTPTSEDLLN